MTEEMRDGIALLRDDRLPWTYDDGGRAAAGFKSAKAGDCVVRAVAIVTGIPYRKVWEDIDHLAGVAVDCGVVVTRSKSPDKGTEREVFAPYIEALGLVWTPTMGIGTGCRVHLRQGEPPMGRLLARCSRHLVAVIDGTIHDTYDSSRDGTRCVYGYWKLEERR